MTDHDDNSLREEEAYEANGGVYSGFCFCGALLTDEDVDEHDSICGECR